jgi:hypothetical protein
MQRELIKYGLLGTVRLCSGRAFWAIGFGFGLLAVLLVLVGQGAAAAIFSAWWC